MQTIPLPPQPWEYYYRYRDVLTQSGSYGSTLYSSFKYTQVTLSLEKFIVLRKTPKGVWIENHKYPSQPEQKFILTSMHRKWAYPTIHEAQIEFMSRKKRQFSIIENQLRQAQAAIHQAASDFNMEPETYKPASVQAVYGDEEEIDF